MMCELGWMLASSIWIHKSRRNTAPLLKKSTLVLALAIWPHLFLATAAVAEELAIIKALASHMDRVWAVAFSPDGRYLATGSWDKTVQIWDAKSLRLIQTFVHTDSVCSLSFSSDSSLLAAAAWDRTVRIWEADTGACIRTIPEGGSWVLFGPGQQLATGLPTGNVEVRNPRTGEIHYTLHHIDPVRSAAFAPDGKVLATASGSAIRLWKLDPIEMLKALPVSGGTIQALAFSYDGKTLAAGGTDGKIYLWDAGEGKQLRVISGHRGTIYSLAFTADSKYLASGGSAGEVMIWDIATGKRLAAGAAHGGVVRAVAFSPDGTTLVSGGDDRTAVVWDSSRVLGVRVNKPPVPDFSWTILSPGARTLSVPRIGAWVEFNAQNSYDPDGKIVSYEWDWDGDGKWDESKREATTTHQFEKAGLYTVMLRVVDDRGASASLSKSLAVAENEAPVSQFTYTPLEPASGQLVRFDAGSSYDPDGSLTQYLWDFGDGSKGTGETISHTYEDGGVFSVTLTVVDDCGAKSSWTKEVSVQDIKAPSPPLMLTAVPTTWTNVNSFTVDWKNPSDPSGITAAWYKLGEAPREPNDGVRVRAHPFVVSATAEGGQVLYVWLEDGRGNKDHMSCATVTLYYDATPPSGRLWVNEGAERTDSLIVTLKVEAEDRGGSGVYEMCFSNDGKTWTPWESFNAIKSRWDLTEWGGADTSGVKMVYVRFKDRAGNESPEVWTTVVYQPTQMPQAAFVYKPEKPTILDAIQFTNLSKDPDGKLVSVMWDFGDGTTSQEPNPIHQYKKKGQFTVRLVVVDDQGLQATVSQTILIANIAPLALFSFSPLNPLTGEEVIFDASSSVDPDGEIQSFRWDLSGDGATDAEGMKVTWRFAKEGEHEVKLFVQDKDGDVSSTTEKVVVGGTLEPRAVWAVVIGIGKYLDSNKIPNLAYARADAEAFYHWLTQIARIPADHVKLLLDQEATFLELRACLAWLKKVMQSGDLGILYFAGHGAQGDDLPPKDEEDDLDEYFVLHDTRYDALEATAFRDDDCATFLGGLPGRSNLLVLFDSCHAGGGARGDRGLPQTVRPLGSNIDIWRDFDLEGKLVLAAAAEDQLSYEDPELGHGVFTYFLLEGLNGAADANRDGKILAEELAEYVQKRVSKYVKQKFGKTQEPKLLGRGVLKFVITKVNLPPRADFSWKPAIPFPGKLVQFVDNSMDDGRITQWFWDFGDGFRSEEQNPLHVYSTPGKYKVSLTVIDEGGLQSSKICEISVTGECVATSLAGEYVLISLGETHGVAVGDRFEVLSSEIPVGDGKITHRLKAIIEVQQVISADRSICKVMQLWMPIQEGDVVRLLVAQ